MATDNPRVTASSAAPAPTTPPPITNTSSSACAIASMASARLAGDNTAASTSVRSLYLNPVQRPLNRLAPQRITPLPIDVRPGGLPPLRLLPVGPQLFCARPETHRQTSGVRRAQRRRLGHHWPAHRHPQ